LRFDGDDIHLLGDLRADAFGGFQAVIRDVSWAEAE
jgi:hypothetical protein